MLAFPKRQLLDVVQLSSTSVPCCCLGVATLLRQIRQQTKSRKREIMEHQSYLDQLDSGVEYLLRDFLLRSHDRIRSCVPFSMRLCFSAHWIFCLSEWCPCLSERLPCLFERLRCLSTFLSLSDQVPCLWVDPIRSLRSQASFFLGNCAERKSRDGREGTLAQLLQ